MKNMETVLTLITQEKEQYEELLALARDKHDSLKQRDLQRLGEIIKKEQGLHFEITLAQQKREKALREAALTMQLPQDEVNLRVLAQAVPEQEEAILALREGFAEVVHQYNKQSEINSRIIEGELDYVNYVLNYMTPEGTAANNYDQAGNTGLESGFRPGLFDQKV